MNRYEIVRSIRDKYKVTQKHQVGDIDIYWKAILTIIIRWKHGQKENEKWPN